jgi:hypothetical protein
MSIVLWIAGVGLGLLGLWITVLNWWIFANRHVLGKNTLSWIPLLGGLFLGGGFAMLPSNPYWHYCWVALLVDWGFIPGLGYSLLYAMCKR